MADEPKTGEETSDHEGIPEVDVAEESGEARGNRKRSQSGGDREGRAGTKQGQKGEGRRLLWLGVASIVVAVITLVLTALALLTDLCKGPPLPPQISAFSVKDSEFGQRIHTRDRYLHRLAISNPTTNPISPIEIELDIHLPAGTAQASPASFNGDCSFGALGTKLSLDCATLAVGETEIVFSTAPVPLQGRFELSAGGAKTAAGEFDCTLPAITGDLQPCELTLPCSGLSLCSVINWIRDLIR